MKRSVAAITALIYLAISSGVVMNIHYCMGKLSSVKLQAWAPQTCVCGKKIESKKGCCKTELKVVKIEDAQKASYAGFNFDMPVAGVVNELSLLQQPFYNSASLSSAVAHSPPLWPKQDIYLLNCVFRI